jgi:hypothetical protein
MAFHQYGQFYNDDPDFDIEAYYLRVAESLIADHPDLFALPDPATTTPPGWGPDPAFVSVLAAPTPTPPQSVSKVDVTPPETDR